MHFTLVKVYFNKVHLKKENNREETAKLHGKVNIKLVVKNFVSILIFCWLHLSALREEYKISLYDYGFVQYFSCGFLGCFSIS